MNDEHVSERRHLMSVAFRMLGTTAAAEDAVQEAYVRWYRLTDEERAAIQVPVAWLTRTVSRICLDVLGSARLRRELYVGPWLPEPIPADTLPRVAADPLDRVTLDDGVSTALLVVLEQMTPAERVVFILHDAFAWTFAEIAEAVGRTPAACRKLASEARKRVRAVRAEMVPRAEHDRVVRAFAKAVDGGDIRDLIEVLDPRVLLRSDGGGIVRAARRPVEGADRVARFLLGVLAKNPAFALAAQETADGLGFVLWESDRVHSVVTVDVRDARIHALRMVSNPEKLRMWRETSHS